MAIRSKDRGRIGAWCFSRPHSFRGCRSRTTSRSVCRCAPTRARATRGQVVERMLQRTGLSAFRDRHPAEFSGGMRQRAAIASVLAINPSTLLMDEPFGSLDSLTRSIMQDFLLEIWEEQRKTVVLVTHDIDEAIYLADKTVVMTARSGPDLRSDSTSICRGRGATRCEARRHSSRYAITSPRSFAPKPSRAALCRRSIEGTIHESAPQIEPHP